MVPRRLCGTLHFSTQRIAFLTQRLNLAAPFVMVRKTVRCSYPGPAITAAGHQAAKPAAFPERFLNNRVLPHLGMVFTPHVHFDLPVVDECSFLKLQGEYSGFFNKL
jgi:hypothetical protein